MAARLLWPAGPGAFRLWLALAVVVHHVTRIEIGKAAVLVFFTLSGYWVHRVWQGRYAPICHPWWHFVVSRWWRIMPVMVVASVACVAAQWATSAPDWLLVRSTPWRQLIEPFAVLGYAQLLTRPVGPGWSLDIEMQFYLVAPLLMVAVQRLRPALIALLAYGLMAATLYSGFGGGVVLPVFLPFFLIGMVAAQHDWVPPRRLADAGLVVAVAGVLVCWLVPAWRPLVDEGSPVAQMLYLVLAALVIPFALTTVRRPSDGIDRLCGDHSFLVYMLHWPAITLWRYLGEEAGWMRVGWARAGIGVVLAISVAIVCAAVWRWVDRPLDRWRRTWVRQQEKTSENGAMCGDDAKGDDKTVILA